MGQLTGMEVVVVLVQAIFVMGIPLVAAIWIIQTLRRVRADNEAIKSKLESIEKKLESPIQN